MSAILGALFAIVLSTFGISQYVGIQKISNDHIQEAVAAQQHVKLNEAASAYVRAFATEIKKMATGTNPVPITVAMLKSDAAGHLLPASFNEKNPYDQEWKVQILQRTPGNLEMLTFSTGGATLKDKTVARISSLIGQAGGFIPHNDSGIYAAGNVYGAFGGWKTSTDGFKDIPDGRSASLLTFNNGQLVSNYLYRNKVPEQEHLNQMNTTLDMNGNSLINANGVTAKTIVTTDDVKVGGDIYTDNLVSTGKLQLIDSVVEGTACTSNGLLSRDSNGFPLFCQFSKWSKPKATPPGYDCEGITSCAMYIPPTTSEVMLTVNYGCTAAPRARTIAYAVYKNGIAVKSASTSCTESFGLSWSDTYKLSAPTNGARYEIWNMVDPIHPGDASFFRMTAFLVN